MGTLETTFNAQKVCLYEITNEYEFGSSGITTENKECHINEILCGPSRDQISCSFNLKISEKDVLMKTGIKLKFGSP